MGSIYWGYKSLTHTPMTTTMRLLEAFGIRQATDELCELAGLEKIEWTEYELTDQEFAELYEL